MQRVGAIRTMHPPSPSPITDILHICMTRPCDQLTAYLFHAGYLFVYNLDLLMNTSFVYTFTYLFTYLSYNVT